MLACASALSLALPTAAPEARPTKKEAVAKKKKKKIVRKQKGSGYSPPYAEIVVDAKTGKVLASENAEEIRHPASLTKVMTLYVLFDELKAGRLTLQTPLTVSAEAARQEPSKLGLRAGQTIPVESAIKALVTKSANDAAVVIAENIAGSESAFAQRMTRKARALGMSSTVYRNASGLPNDEQVTTARDLALLGRAIQDNHPDYYKYFSTRSFSWGGQTYSNHNRLLGNVEGVDGIKTGYIRASGFNLLTSAKDNGRHVVAVVLGGRSSSTRDAQMRKLIAQNLPKAAPGRRTAPLIAEGYVPPEPAPVLAVAASAPVRASMAGSALPPLPTPRPALRTAAATPLPAKPPADLPDPVLAAVAASAPQQPVEEPVPAAAPPATAAPLPAVSASATETPRNPTMTPDAIVRRIDTANRIAMETTTPGGDMRWVVGAQPAPSSSVSAYAGTTTPGSAARIAAQQAIAEAAPVKPVATAAAPAVPAAPAPIAAPAQPVANAAPIVPAPVAAPAVAAAVPAPVAASAPVATPKVVQTLAIEPAAPIETAVAPAVSEPDMPPLETASAISLTQSPEAAQPEPASAPAIAETIPVAAPAIAETAPASTTPPPGWQIQVAATPDPAQARAMLDRISGTIKSVDRTAEPYTEPVEKDGVTLYRVRYAGFSERTANAACKAVKKSSLSCFTLRN